MKSGIFESLFGLKEVFTNYLSARVNLWKIILLEKMAKTGTFVMTSITVLTFFSFVLLFLTFAFSFWYGEKYGSLAVGFLIAAGFYFLVALLVILFRKLIFSGTLIRSFRSVLFSDEEKSGK